MDDFSPDDLDARSARLGAAYDPDRFAREANEITELLRSYLEGASLQSRPVWPATPAEDLLEVWPDPEAGAETELGQLLADVLAGSTSQHHPGFVGQQLSVPPPMVGPVAMLSAILNNSAAIYEGAPLAAALEHRLVSWMAGKIGYGEEAGGALTSGGTLGTLTALAAMRQARAGHDPWGEGLAGGDRHAILVSGEAHYSNSRACAVLGFGERAVIPVPTDARFRMDLRSLGVLHDQARESGAKPIAVIASAGSTSTGSHDDLDAVATFCEERGLWFHVDAAHGGAALLSPRYASKLDGIARADSVVWDAHKMMLMPSLCTGVLVREAKHLSGAFRQHAPYLLSDSDATWHNPATKNFETTKPTLVLPLYVTLRILGAGYLAEYLEYSYDLARAFADEVDRREEFELLVRPESNIVCFRRRAAAGDSDALQLALRDTVNERGRFLVMRTVLRGSTWLRVVLMNPSTRFAQLCELLDELSQVPAR